MGASGHADLNWFEGRDATQASGSRLPAGLVTRSMIVMSDASNGHNSTIMPEDSVVDGWIAWNSLDGDNGDDNMLITSTTAGGNRNLVIKNGVVLKRPSGGDVGTVSDINGSTACSGANCPQVSFLNNTWSVGPNVGNQLSVTVESNVGFAGVYQAVRNNLVHRYTNGVGQVINFSSNLPVVNGAFVNADYNWTHNITSSPKYYSKAGAFAEYNATPGANDQSGDPLFVDVTRNPISYGARWDPSIRTLDQLADKYRACYLNGADGVTPCDPRFNLADMYNWIRAGWRTRNPATWTAGAGGTHVGGVAPTKNFGVFAQ